jgi:hypothetical protein
MMNPSAVNQVLEERDQNREDGREPPKDGGPSPTAKPSGDPEPLRAEAASGGEEAEEEARPGTNLDRATLLHAPPCHRGCPLKRGRTSICISSPAQEAGPGHGGGGPARRRKPGRPLGGQDGHHAGHQPFG